MFHIDLPEMAVSRLAVKLNRDGQRSVKQGHPWIFDKSISKLNKEGEAGDLAIIFDNTSNKVLGIGLYDPYSPIRIKMLHSEGPAEIGSEFFHRNIEKAFDHRRPLLETDTNSYRLIFGENDGFPGLIVDVYADTIVLKLYSAIWFPFLKSILEILVELLQPKAIVLRLSRNLQKLGLNKVQDGMVISGSLETPRIIFREHGVLFSADVVHGHKTGYFLDHRHNRKRVGELAKGKRVLDVFSYAGGFSVHALAGGAESVHSVDVSAPALEMAELNAGLNKFKGKHETACGDAFEIMRDLILQGKQYDIVVIDPPSFAKRKSEIPGAIRKYQDLAKLGSKLTTGKGLLVLASCSSRIGKNEFLEVNEKVLDNISRPYELKLVTTHDLDHPVIFPEGAYLKCAYYQFRT